MTAIVSMSCFIFVSRCEGFETIDVYGFTSKIILATAELLINLINLYNQQFGLFTGLQSVERVIISHVYCSLMMADG